MERITHRVGDGAVQRLSVRTPPPGHHKRERQTELHPLFMFGPPSSHLTTPSTSAILCLGRMCFMRSPRRCIAPRPPRWASRQNSRRATGQRRRVGCFVCVVRQQGIATTHQGWLVSGNTSSNLIRRSHRAMPRKRVSEDTPDFLPTPNTKALGSLSLTFRAVYPRARYSSLPHFILLRTLARPRNNTQLKHQ